MGRKKLVWYNKHIGWLSAALFCCPEVYPMKVLCYGDSNTYGYDPRGIFTDRYDENWCDLLAEKTGWEIINGGSNGRSLPGSNRWIDSYLQKYESVDRVLILMGTNDILQGRLTERILVDMDALLEHLQTTWQEIDVVLLAPPPITFLDENFDAQLVEVIGGYGHLAGKRKISFVDTRSWGLPMAFDGVHLSESGHQVFAEKLVAYFR